MALTAVKYRDIPTYLHESALFHSLNAEEPDESIEIPTEFYKADDLVSNEQDLLQLLNAIKFWGVDTIPNTLTQYLLDHKYPESEVLNDLTVEVFVHIKSIFRYQAYRGAILANAITQQRTEVVYYLVGAKVDIKSNAPVGVAARVGRLDYLVLLKDNGYRGDGFSEFAEAAHADHVSCLQYLHEKSRTLPMNIVTAAISGDAVRCLEYAYTHLDSVGPTIQAIVIAGSARCLAYVLQRGELFLENMCVELIRAGPPDSSKHRSKHADHVGCLRNALTHGYVPKTHHCKFACEDGALDMLRVLLEFNCTVDQSCVSAATQAGHLDCLMFLHEIGCPWGDETTTVAALAGKLDCLRYAISHNCATSKDILLHAARRNHVHILQYLIEEQGMYMDENNALFEAAFDRFNLESVMYLIDIGCPFVDFQFFWLSAFQRLDDARFLKCIVYAVEHGWRNPASLIPALNRVMHALPECSRYLTEHCDEDAGKGEVGRNS